MLLSEFIERTNYQPFDGEYELIEDSYYEFDGNKDEFCKWWKKAYKSGEWAKEYKLRKQIKDLTAEYEAKLKEKYETIEFYEPYFDRARLAEALLNCFGKKSVFNFKLRDEDNWRKLRNVELMYINNGKFRFINVIEESGWISSYRIETIEYIEMR